MCPGVERNASHAARPGRVAGTRRRIAFYKAGGRAGGVALCAFVGLACAGQRAPTANAVAHGAARAAAIRAATPAVVDAAGRVPAREAEQALGQAAATRAYRRRARALANAVERKTGSPLVRC
jgi:hypothetical protein